MAYLVPRRLGLSEIVELAAQDRAALIEEIAAASAFLRALPGVDKLNVGALGNIVAQLHVHVAARAVGDPAWPGPAWGVGAARPYERGAAEALIARARAALMGPQSRRPEPLDWPPAALRPAAHYPSASAPACATCSSSADFTPETPIAPTHSSGGSAAPAPWMRTSRRERSQRPAVP